MTPLRNIPPYWNWTTYTPVIPKLYWDIYSTEERIKRLAREYDKLSHYASSIADTVNGLSDEVETELQNALDEVQRLLSEMNEEWRAILEQLQESSTDWDVQQGYATSSVEAMRDMFNDVTVHGITVDELNALDYTVDSLAESGVNCRGLAVMGTMLSNDDRTPQINTNGMTI